MKQDQRVYCGVDVSKAHLDAFINGKTKTFPNTVDGVHSLMTHAQGVHFVFESTGGYERTAVWMLLAADRPASIINPALVRHYAISIGQRAKTDPIDARIITQYAAHVHPESNQNPSKHQRTLCACVDRRQQLTDMRTAEKNRLDTAGDPVFRRMVQKHLRWIEKEIAALDEKIVQTIREDGQMYEASKQIQQIKGLGRICAATLLAHLPEIGTLSRQEAAALAGLAPYCRDSGTMSFRRHIQGGRKRLRACLYMAAVCAIQHNPAMKEFYRRLTEDNHRPPKVALTAVMRKLLIAANSAVKNSSFGLAA
jgi:transposase